MAYVYLLAAIIFEVMATLSLKASALFTKPLPSLLVVVGYVLAFYCLTLVLRTLPLAVTYAIWSGVGLLLITIFSACFYKEVPDLPAIIGMLLIILGMIIIQMFSKTMR